MENSQIKETHTYLEDNAINFENDGVYDFSFETNKNIDTKPPNKTKNKTSLNIISKFVFLFAVVATIQVGIYIPVFSEIFTPAQNTTQERVYITGIITKITYDTNYKYLNIKLKTDPSFVNYDKIYFELYNLSTNVVEPNYSVQPKQNIEEPDVYGAAGIAIPIERPPTNYQLRLYCSTDHLENIEYTDTLVYDETTFYLFYVHNEPLNI